ncbi:hypothetical protein DFQ28_011680 [Apophysomyces sp. BC1034]|nr:hypothetical protein DFQ29_010095 [Apophysomyces sp. BC1021]KAG0184152.1 hypothetical protein DFQ28_011680 [Apophysomyces sp. BC1034]
MGGLFHRDSNRGFRLTPWSDKKVSNTIQEERTVINATLNRTPSGSSLAEKWGTCQEIIGKGAFGVVRVAHKPDAAASGTGEQLYAEFRRKGSESTQTYTKRLISEFGISSILRHTNVIQTFDLLPLNENSSVYCQVMEYCDGSDLFNVISESSEGLYPAEANCFFKQLMRGVAYLHGMGVAHRDLKPENLLLTRAGCLKISDFGSAECFRLSDSETVYKSKGLVGSEPYIAPEEFAQDEYDAWAVDIWSCGIIYMALKTGNHLWHVAKKDEDESYHRFLKFRQLVDEERENARRERNQRARTSPETMTAQEREHERDMGVLKARETIRRRAKEGGMDLLEGLEFGAKKLVYRMLDPNPNKRITASEVVVNEWLTKVWSCQS